MLAKRHVELSLGVRGRGGLAHITDNTHDRSPLDGQIETPHDAMPDGIFLSKSLPRQSFADDRNRRASVQIRWREIAPANERDPHGREVSRSAQTEARMRQKPIVAGDGVFPFDGIGTA